MKVAVAKVEIEFTVDMLASAFALLTDDEQAQFFTKVSGIADSTYTDGLMKHPESNADWQWRRVGDHLRTCDCATPRGREMVRTIYEAMTS